MILQDYIMILKRLGFALAFYVISRLGFYFYNLNYFHGFEFKEIFTAFLYGFRFDIVTVFVVNLFYILISLIPVRNIKIEKIIKWTFISFNFVFLGFIFVDYELFIFLGRKMTFDIFDMALDIKGQMWQLTLYYWFNALLVIASGILLWRFYPAKIHVETTEHLKKWQQALVTLVILVVTIIGVRGGVQLRSIGPKDAFVYEHFELGNLTINAAYTMARSLGNKGAEVEKYFETDEKAKEYIQQTRMIEFGNAVGKNSNIVIIIMESLSQEYVDNGFTPYFEKLAKEGLYFNKNFTNGRRSIEALPSIMTGFPSLLSKPLYQTQFQSNRYYALPSTLKKHGYQTAFFHGGQKGTMEFDSYCYFIGFDKYYSKNDYPNSDHFDGNWGIYDHHFLKFFSDEMDKMKEPFLTGIFTLSSHQPYSIPPEYQGKFPKGNLEIHESIGYADEALRLFLEDAKNKSWYENTLFIITADHTSKLATEKFGNLLGRYRAPLLFYHPKKNLKRFYHDRITQQADILPSVLDFLGIEPEKRLLYGSSVFGGDSGRMINYSSGQYFFVRDEYLLRYNRKDAKLYKLNEQNFVEGSVKDRNSKESMLQELKAYIQYTNNGLRKNNIYQL